MPLIGACSNMMTDTRRHRISSDATELLHRGAGGLAAPCACAFRQGPVLRAQEPVRGGHPGIRDSDRARPQLGNALAALGQCKFFTGSSRREIPAHEQAIRLSPRDPLAPNWYWRIGRVHLLQSRHGRSDPVARKGKSRQLPARGAACAGWPPPTRLKDEMNRRRAELAEARRLSRDGRYREYRPSQIDPIPRLAEDPRAGGGDVFRRAAQGGRAGGMSRLRLRPEETRSAAWVGSGASSGRKWPLSIAPRTSSA